MLHNVTAGPEAEQLKHRDVLFLGVLSYKGMYCGNSSCSVSTSSYWLLLRRRKKFPWKMFISPISLFQQYTNNTFRKPTASYRTIMNVPRIFTMLEWVQIFKYSTTPTWHLLRCISVTQRRRLRAAGVGEGIWGYSSRCGSHLLLFCILLLVLRRSKFKLKLTCGRTYLW